MKPIRIFFFCLAVSMSNLVQAQDTLYIIKKGLVDFKQALTDIDSLSFVNSLYPTITIAIAKDSNFTLFSKALEMTGIESIIRNSPEEDETYTPNNCPWAAKTYNIKEEIPKYRKFGFTILLESDETLANYKDCPLCPSGIKTIDDLKNLAKYYYSINYEGLYSDGENVDDPKDSRNYLNRFVAYHCMNRTLTSTRFIDDFDTPNQVKTYDMYEFIEPMLANTLIKVKKERDQNNTFFFNMWDEVNTSTGIQLTKDINNDSRNGFYHAIDKPLVYSKKVNDYIASNRIRMDAASLFREFATNNLRGNNPTAQNGEGIAHRYIIPPGYCEDMQFSPATRMTYIGANGIYEDYQGDELYVEGKYDFTITTPPIPAGKYEVRFGYQPTGWRGYAQLYFDNANCGEPINFTLLQRDILLGIGNSSDSALHANGYMRGLASYKCFIALYYNPNTTAYGSGLSLRKIVGSFTFPEPGKHTLRIQNTGTSGGDVQFMLDYLEFVPVSILKNEGVD